MYHILSSSSVTGASLFFLVECISSSSSLPYLPVRLVNLATAYVLLFGVASDRSELCYSNAS